MFYVSLMVSTKQKPIIETRKRNRKKSKHATIENHQITKDERKKERNKGTINNQKTMNKMALVKVQTSQ